MVGKSWVVGLLSAMGGVPPAKGPVMFLPRRSSPGSMWAGLYCWVSWSQLDRRPKAQVSLDRTLAEPAILTEWQFNYINEGLLGRSNPRPRGSTMRSLAEMKGVGVSVAKPTKKPAKKPPAKAKTAARPTPPAKAAPKVKSTAQTVGVKPPVKQAVSRPEVSAPGKGAKATVVTKMPDPKPAKPAPVAKPETSATSNKAAAVGKPAVS